MSTAVSVESRIDHVVVTNETVTVSMNACSRLLPTILACPIASRFIVPGTSLHGELQRLTECGLTPYETIRTATVNTAVFLGKDQVFGTVAVGKRADLLLVEENPLKDLTTLREPIGVMVRGEWFTREELQHVLAGLRAKG